MLKGKTKIQASDETAEQSFSEQQEAQYRDNPRINQQIDDYIHNNPREWEYIQRLPRERLERQLVLKKLNKLEQRHRAEQRAVSELEKDPALKELADRLLKNVPEAERTKAITDIVRSVKTAQRMHQEQQEQQQRQEPPGMKMAA